MKYKLAVILVLGLWLVVGFGSESGYATSSNRMDHLNPNEYKEKQFKDNKEYLQDDSLLKKNRKAIPDEQKPLDFVPDDYDPNEKVKGELFVKDFQERKTVTYESVKLGLFSDEKETAIIRADPSKSKGEGQSRSLQFIYLGLLFVCILIVLIWLIPKIVQGEKNS